MKPFASSLAVAALVGAMAGLLSALAPPAIAQTKSDAEIRQQYLAERAACLRGRTGEDQQTCLREAGAAAQAARQGKLLEGERENYRSNALARCAPLPPEQREACRMRIEGAGTVTGSVEEGGLFRELRIQVPASEAASTTAPSSAAPPPAAAPSPAAPASSTTTAPAPATTVVPASPATAPVVVPGAASTAPAASTPSATGSSGIPGGPTFTPVQPAIPGRSVPSAPRSSAPPAPSTTEAASSRSLQITPPTNPVMQVPASPPTYSPQPALAAPVPAAPEPALVTPGSVPPGGAR